MVSIKELEFKKLSEIDNEILLKFYSIAYPNRNNIIYKNWKWIYRTSLFGHEPIVALYKKDIVGHAGLISTNLIHNKKILEEYGLLIFIFYQNLEILAWVKFLRKNG